MESEKEKILEVKNLKKYFPIERGLLRKTVGYIKAVDDVSLTIEKAGTLGLVGETGSGKTTLGRLILRLLPADSGEVLFESRNILNFRGRELKNLRQDMQIIFQDPYGSLNPRMRVGDIIAEGMKVFHRGNKEDIGKKVGELLKIVGLSPEAVGLYPHEFSGGQRQRIGIARAISLHPKLIICDEPVSSLDVSIQAQILNLLADLQARLGLAYLFIAHDLSVVEHIADRVAVMYRGRIVEMASNRQIYQNPLHPYTRVLLKSIPVPDPEAPPPGRELKATELTVDDSQLSGCLFSPRCPRSTKLCREKTPLLQEVGPGHLVACHEVKR